MIKKILLENMYLSSVHCILTTNLTRPQNSKLQFSSKCLCIGWLSSFNKFWRVSYMKFHKILLKINYDFQFLLRFFYVVVFLLFLLTLDHTELSTRLSTNLGWAWASFIDKELVGFSFSVWASEFRREGIDTWERARHSEMYCKQ